MPGAGAGAGASWSGWLGAGDDTVTSSRPGIDANYIANEKDKLICNYFSSWPVVENKTNQLRSMITKRFTCRQNSLGNYCIPKGELFWLQMYA